MFYKAITWNFKESFQNGGQTIEQDRFLYHDKEIKEEACEDWNKSLSKMLLKSMELAIGKKILSCKMVPVNRDVRCTVEVLVIFKPWRHVSSSEKAAIAELITRSLETWSEDFCKGSRCDANGFTYRIA